MNRHLKQENNNKSIDKQRAQKTTSHKICEGIINEYTWALLKNSFFTATVLPRSYNTSNKSHNNYNILTHTDLMEVRSSINVEHCSRIDCIKGCGLFVWLWNHSRVHVILHYTIFQWFKCIKSSFPMLLTLHKTLFAKSFMINVIYYYMMWLYFLHFCIVIAVFFYSINGWLYFNYSLECIACLVTSLL